MNVVRVFSDGMKYYTGIFAVATCIAFVVILGGQLIRAVRIGYFRLDDSSKIIWQDEPRRYLSQCVFHAFFVLSGMIGLAKIVPLLLDFE